MNTEVEKNLDEIMKKYDKESNVRVFDGKLRWVVLILLAAFSVFGIYMNMFAMWDVRVGRTLFVGCVIFLTFFVYPAKKSHLNKVNFMPWYDMVLAVVGAASYFYFVVHANRIIKQLKSYAKSMNFDSSYDPYKAAYASMPTSASSNHEIKQQYINGHFCYAYKFGIITNGLGIVRSIDFYNKDYLTSHPDIVVEKKAKSPDEDKSLADSKALLPTLKDFKTRHPGIKPSIFLGDAAFDTIEIYKSLFEDFNFKKAFIPLKVNLSMDNVKYTFNENGIPCCPHDSSLPMKREGSKSHLRSKLSTMKFVCPKMKWEYNRQDKSKRRVCHCDNPCTTSSCGRMIYVYPEKNLRAYPGVERGSKEWDETYKIRVNVEKSINHFKDSFCIAQRKTTKDCERAQRVSQLPIIVFSSIPMLFRPFHSFLQAIHFISSV